MGRRVFTTFAATSLVFCATIVTMWVRTCSEIDEVQDTSDANRYIVTVGGGQFVVSATTYDPFRQVTQGWSVRRWTGGHQVEEQLLWNRSIIAQNTARRPLFGFWWQRMPLATPPAPSIQAPASVFLLIGPLWLVALLFTVPAMLWLPSYLRWRKARARTLGGRCASCGYDLRASAGRCPECGTTPEHEIIST